MELKKTGIYISFFAFSILLCPASVLALLSFSVVVIALVICSIKNKWFDHSENIDFKSALAAFSVNLIILFVFIMRWSEIINPVVVSLAGLALSVIATPLLPVIVHSYTNTNERINLSTKKISLSDHIVFMLFLLLLLLLLPLLLHW